VFLDSLVVFNSIVLAIPSFPLPIKPAFFEVSRENQGSFQDFWGLYRAFGPKA
jgi:hypothetical protein